MCLQLGGPSWRVLLGRRDSTTANLSLANSDLPAPTLDLANLTAAFARKGLSRTDLVALSGAHTIGQAQCLNFRGHIYNDTNVNPAFATLRRANCPAAAGNGDGNLAPLDTTTSTVFDNAYYTNLLAQSGLLHSDQKLFNGGATDGLVRTYASTPTRFNRDFGAAMIRMGNLSPPPRVAKPDQGRLLKGKLASKLARTLSTVVAVLGAVLMMVHAQDQNSPFLICSSTSCSV